MVVQRRIKIRKTMEKAGGVKILLKVVTKLLGALTILKSSNVSVRVQRRSWMVDVACNTIGPTPNSKMFAA